MSNVYPQIICLGEALVDRLGPLGVDPLQVNNDEDLLDCFGGAPANVACALAKLGISTALVGRLGADEIAESFQRLLRSRGVNLSALQLDDLLPTRIVLVKRDPIGERTFNGFVGDVGKGFADQALDSHELLNTLEPLLSNAKWLLIGSIPLASPSSCEALELAVKCAIAQGVNIVFDVNWRPTFWDCSAPDNSGPSVSQIAKIRVIFEQASLLKLAGEEADWFFQTRDPERISLSLPNKPAVVITDGSREIKWFFSGQGGVINSFKVNVVDSTGAGDGFLAGLLYQLCKEPWNFNSLSEKSVRDRISQAIIYGNACGALICTGSGAIDPQPTNQEVLDFLGKYASC